MSSLPKLAPVPNLTRRDHVAEALRRAILSGLIAPGTQLVESRLASELAVSRGPVSYTHLTLPTICSV